MPLGDFVVRDINGQYISLARYDGMVVLIVNTASKCGFAGQFSGLQKLFSTYGARGLTVLGFPCNQFLHQEPGSSSEIQAFCTFEYSVTFPMFEKVDVNGDAAHPLYVWLRDEARGLFGSTAVKWNFTKFLLNRRGEPVVRYAPTMDPSNIAPTIERLLQNT